MKKNLILSAVVLSQTAMAQTPQLPAFPKKHNTAKTTAPMERLIARTVLDYYAGVGYEFTDSATMVWNWTNFSKTEFLPAPIVSFDRTTESYFYNNPAGVPTPVQKSVNFFDGSGRIYANYRLRWNAGTSTWDSAARTLTNWSGALVTDSTYDVYTGSRGWIGRRRTTITYSGGNLESITNEVSSGLTTSWNNDTRTLYFWTGAKLTQTQSDRWESASSSWVKQYKNDISYTGSDSTLSITSRWNNVASVWVNSIRRCYKISSSGPYADDSTYIWNASTSSWNPSSKNAVIYVGSDVSQYIQYIWDVSTNNWGAYNIVYYLYNAGSQLTEAGAYRWNTTLASWEVYYYYKYFYNAAGSLTMELPFVLNTSGGYDPGSNRRHYYYETYTGISESKQAQANAVLFPNPVAAGQQVQLQFNESKGLGYTLSVRDLLGRAVYQSEGSTASTKQEMLPADTWSSGAYLISIRYEDGRSETLKLINRP